MCCFKSGMFFSSSLNSLNQLGKVNELLIRPELPELTEEREDEEEEVRAEEEKGSSADNVFTAANLESALNQVFGLEISHLVLLCFNPQCVFSPPKCV